MRKFVFIRAVLAALGLAGTALAGGWSTSVPFTNQVAGDVITGGGYAGYDPGATAPNPGSCRLGLYNANRSESWIAVKPGTENLVGIDLGSGAAGAEDRRPFAVRVRRP